MMQSSSVTLREADDRILAIMIKAPRPGHVRDTIGVGLSVGSHRRVVPGSCRGHDRPRAIRVLADGRDMPRGRRG